MPFHFAARCFEALRAERFLSVVRAFFRPQVPAAFFAVRPWPAAPEAEARTSEVVQEPAAPEAVLGEAVEESPPAPAVREEVRRMARAAVQRRRPAKL